MEKNYHEVLVDKSHTYYMKTSVNGHDFELFFEYLKGAQEWYAGIVGILPVHLESEHKKPGLIARGPSREDCEQEAMNFLEETFPAWSKEKRKAWEDQVAAEEEAARREAEEKKKKAAAAKKAAKS